MLSLEDRYAADVFGLTYREFAEAKPNHYKWRVVAPAAVKTLASAQVELWSAEKLADYLYTHVDEATQSLRRYVMSKRANAGESGGERISILFEEWLARFEPDSRVRKTLALELSRLLASQLQLAAASGEPLEEIARCLEGPPPKSGEGEPGWGPQWKD
jgi:hypothetical protein